MSFITQMKGENLWVEAFDDMQHDTVSKLAHKAAEQVVCSVIDIFQQR